MTSPLVGPAIFQRSMTLLPSPLAQSTLGEKCAVYLDHVTDNIPEFLHSLRPRLDPYLTYLSPTPFRSVAQALPFDADEQTTAICAAILICILTIVGMSWGNPLSGFWRRSPNYATAPQVSDEDFSYITPDYIVDPPAMAPPQHGGQYAGNAADNEPDIIRLRHRGTIYPLHFPAFAIDDGALNIAALRQAAAAKVGANNPNRVRLLYKGNLLKDDSRPCKAEGLKQHSEVLCVVSEVDANTPSDHSDRDSGQLSDSRVRPDSSSSRIGGDEDGDSGSASKSRKKSKSKNKKKNKGKKSTEGNPPRDDFLAPPTSVPSRPSSSGGSAYMPPPSPNIKNLGALEQVSALLGYLKQEIVPLCDEYVADPPSDPKKREFEHKKLSETILAQIMLKADGIVPDGDATIRNARKALIKEAQANLDRLDQVGK